MGSCKTCGSKQCKCTNAPSPSVSVAVVSVAVAVVPLAVAVVAVAIVAVARHGGSKLVPGCSCSSGSLVFPGGPSSLGERLACEVSLVDSGPLVDVLVQDADHADLLVLEAVKVLHLRSRSSEDVRGSSDSCSSIGPGREREPPCGFRGGKWGLVGGGRAR